MSSMSYRDAGVDRGRAAQAISEIKRLAERTHRPELISSIGGFAGAMRLPQGYRSPVLLASADGVGTKLLLLQQLGRWHTAGVDLVAMNVNDILAQGGRPLFFLDYVAAGRLDPGAIVQIVAGVADACVQAGCTLLGGETAEVPGLLATDQMELAGFAVGICEGEELMAPDRLRAGDVVVGIASSGAHSNGFSLIRRVLAHVGVVDGDGLVQEAEFTPSGWDRPLLDVLLEPTRIYVPAVVPLLSSGVIRSMAHITGGGLPDNLARVLPPGLGMRLDPKAWDEPPLFQWLAAAGRIDRREMYHTFNMGIGFCLVVEPAAAERIAAEVASRLQAAAWIIGEIVPGQGVAGLW